MGSDRASPKSRRRALDFAIEFVEEFAISVTCCPKGTGRGPGIFQNRKEKRCKKKRKARIVCVCAGRCRESDLEVIHGIIQDSGIVDPVLASDSESDI